MSFENFNIESLFISRYISNPNDAPELKMFGVPTVNFETVAYFVDATKNTLASGVKFGSNNFFDLNLLTRVTNILRAPFIDPHAIVIEISEAMFADPEFQQLLERYSCAEMKCPTVMSTDSVVEQTNMFDDGANVFPDSL